MPNQGFAPDNKAEVMRDGLIFVEWFNLVSTRGPRNTTPVEVRGGDLILCASESKSSIRATIRTSRVNAEGLDIPGVSQCNP